MAGGRALAESQSQRASPGRVRSQTGRLDYGLHERVLPHPEHPQIQEKVQESRRFVQEHCRADILRLRGPQWEASVHAFPGKHCQQRSDQLLSNSLSPALIRASAGATGDLRHALGSTHSPVRRLQAPDLERNAPGAQGAWNASTSVERREVLQGAQQVTQRSVAATKARNAALLSSSGTARPYVPPAELTAQLTAQQRAAKAAGQDSSQVLEQLYGEEGASAMRATMQLPQWQRQQLYPEDAAIRRRRAGRGAPTAADLEAVAALPEDVAPPSRGGADGNQQGDEAQALSGEEGAASAGGALATDGGAAPIDAELAAAQQAAGAHEEGAGPAGDGMQPHNAAQAASAS